MSRQSPPPPSKMMEPVQGRPGMSLAGEIYRLIEDHSGDCDLRNVTIRDLERLKMIRVHLESLAHWFLEERNAVEEAWKKQRENDA